MMIQMLTIMTMIQMLTIMTMMTSCDGLTQVLYKRTSNLTQESWSKVKYKSLGAKSVGVCGAACVKHQARCNAFQFSYTTNICQLGNVTFLEDTDGGPTANVHVDVETIANVDQICRGGDHCCTDTAFSLCQPGEGDCNENTDCQVGSICVTGACTALFGYSGGLWDSGDDCCEQACTPAHPCTHGLGVCETLDDCEGGEAFECSECLGPRFPESDFPGIGSVGYNSTDKCCRKLCLSSDPCPYETIGCQWNTDCMPGLFCNETFICDDIDECLLDSNVCEADEVCINFKGSDGNPEISKGYRCVKKEEEKVAVVFGGINYRVSPDVYRSSVVEVLTRHKAECMNHAIPLPHFSIRLAGIAFVKGHIVICGGNDPEESSYLLPYCHTLNVNAEGSTWRAIHIPDTRREFGMTELNGYVYLIGGYYDWDGGGAHATVYRFNVDTDQLDRVADTRTIYSYQACSTQLRNEIWVFGGRQLDGFRHSIIDVYSASSNSWTAHSSLPTGMEMVACAVIKNSKDDHEWMVHSGGGYEYYSYIRYWDLTTNEGWHGLKESVSHRYATLVPVSPYEALLVGTGAAASYGRGKVWAWDEYHQYISQSWMGDMQEDHSTGVAVSIPANSAMVKHCVDPHIVKSVDYSKTWKASHVLENACEFRQPAPNYWVTPNEKTGSSAYLILSLGKITKLNRLKIKNTHNGYLNDRGAKNIALYTSHFKEGPWEAVAEKLMPDAAHRGCDVPVEEVYIAPTYAHFVKLVINSYYGEGGGLKYFAADFIPVDCQIGIGEDYSGFVSKTISGLPCQKWSSQSPHQHDIVGLGDHNYCRNPDGIDGVWCYTANPDVRWQFCDVPVCEWCPGSGPGWMLVRSVPAGAAWHPATDQLRGTEEYGNPNDKNEAFSIMFDQEDFNQFLFSTGDCEKWLIARKDQVIGEDGNAFYSDEERNIVKSSISESEYKAKWFRREGSLEDPWISLTDHSTAKGNNDILYGGKSWEGQNAGVLSQNNGARLFIRKDDCQNGIGEDYSGFAHKTTSGIPCQKWSSQSPHEHDLDGLGDHNYCRNPDGEPGVWCYTTNPDVRYELCDVPVCEPHCGKEYEIVYYGDRVDEDTVYGEDDCANWCRVVGKCVIWSIRPSTNTCWLLGSKANRKVKLDRISGRKICLPGDLCTGDFQENGRPSPGTKCVEHKGILCYQDSGRWGKNFCHTDAEGGNWGGECVTCGNK